MKHANIKRTARVAICALLMLSLAFSLIFVIASADHDCTGDGCPVCLQISTFFGRLRLMGAMGVVFALGRTLVRPVSRAALASSAFHRAMTLVTLKVKLSD